MLNLCSIFTMIAFQLASLKFIRDKRSDLHFVTVLWFESKINTCSENSPGLVDQSIAGRSDELASDMSG